MSQNLDAGWIIDDPKTLVSALIRQGWRVVGPRVRDGAIVYDELPDADGLPKGHVDVQEAGHYRLASGDPERWFDYVVGPQSWKKWLFPARQKLWSAERREGGFEISAHRENWPRTAFFGVRACEIAAMQVQDRVFDNGEFADPGYLARRAETLIVVVQCARSAATCFCASMNTGPRALDGFDLALTELEADDGAGILVEVGSDRGREITAAMRPRAATAEQIAAARAATETAAGMQTRTMPEGVPKLIADNLDHPHWDVLADRCLSCANCTLACPTCFCSDVEDVNDLAGEHTERWRSWDSCFTAEFSYVHGGSVRRSTKSRYRQWMSHKLSSWHEQFGSSGCVGCGRCITWCPVGIDITAEAAALAAAAQDGKD